MSSTLLLDNVRIRESLRSAARPISTPPQLRNRTCSYKLAFVQAILVGAQLLSTFPPQILLQGAEVSALLPDFQLPNHFSRSQAEKYQSVSVVLRPGPCPSAYNLLLPVQGLVLRLSPSETQNKLKFP
eukprot:3659818-Rhodomonas_salina.1